MSLPTRAEMATKAGVVQSQGISQNKASKVDKREEARVKKSEEDEAGAKAQAGIETPPAPGAGEGEQARGKKVRKKLSEVLAKAKGKGKPQAQQVQQAQIQQASSKEKAQEAKIDSQESGRRVAQARLNEQGRLAQIRLTSQNNYQHLADPQNLLSPAGKQKFMLDKLIAYQQNNLMQHTGDKCGEAYNRPACRQILQALHGLRERSSESTSTQANKDSGEVYLSPAAYRAKSEKATDMLNLFMLADRQPPEGYEAYEQVA